MTTRKTGLGPVGRSVASVGTFGCVTPVLFVIAIVLAMVGLPVWLAFGIPFGGAALLLTLAAIRNVVSR